MNRVKNIMCKNSIIVLSILMGLIIPDLLTAADKPASKPFSIKGPRMLKISEIAHYSITVFNSGKNSKKDTRVVLRLPQNLKYIGATQKGAVTPSKGRTPSTIAWQLGTIDPGKQSIITLRVQAEKSGKISIEAECSDSTKSKPVKASTATSIVGVPHIKMGCYDTEDPVEVGKNTTFVLEIMNDGSSPCTNINIEYQIPEQMKFVSARVPPGTKYSAEGNTVKFASYPILSPGQRLTYRIVCNVIDEGSAKGKATLTYDQGQTPLTDIEGTSCFR